MKGLSMWTVVVVEGSEVQGSNDKSRGERGWKRTGQELKAFHFL